MLRSYPRFHNFGSALRRSRSWSIFRHFGRENSAVVPNSGVLLFTITTASPRRNKTKIQKGRDPNIKNGRETIFQAGDETLGGKEILIERERESGRYTTVCVLARDDAYRGRARDAEASLPRSPSPRGLSDGPGAVRVGAHMTRLRGPPRGHPTLPGINGTTALPLFFDTTPALGATKLRAMFLSPFSQLRERFETLAVVVNFSSFWAGKFRPHAKLGCVVHHSHGVSPTK